VNREIEDAMQLTTEWAFSPNLQREGMRPDKFGHINKNLVLTHLRSATKDMRSRGELGDDQKILKLLDSVQVLKNHNKTDWYVKLDGEWTTTGYKEYRAAKKQGYETDYIVTNRFNETIHVLLGEIFSITSVASGRGGALIQTWNTQTNVQKQSIKEEQNTGKRRFYNRHNKYN
jgi:hypothetical protein